MTVCKRLFQTLEESCVKFFHGYDSNFVPSVHPIATAVGDKTGITLIVDTDQPGVQFYTPMP